MMSKACDSWHLKEDRQAVPPLAINNLPSLENLLVLVVDDNADSLFLTTLILQEYGMQVMTATSASEAFEVIRESKLDVLISDIAMPGEDGYSLIRKIRTLPPEKGGLIPAVALTACVREEDRTEALGSGFQMHVSKPVEPTELVSGVARLAGRSLPT